MNTQIYCLSEYTHYNRCSLKPNIVRGYRLQVKKSIRALESLGESKDQIVVRLEATIY
jgi:hypothetical protein